MQAKPTLLPRWLRWRPRTLFGRMVLVLCAGLALAQGLTFAVIVAERMEATTNLMLGYMEQDVASSVALLNRLPAAEREEWLPRLARRSYRFVLGPPVPGSVPSPGLSAMLVASLEQALGRDYRLEASAVRAPGGPLQVALHLGDGTPLTIELRPRGLPLSQWLVPTLLGQLVLLAALCWLCVRLATRPLRRLADAADALGPDLRAAPLPESGPQEVARAAGAFNAMQRRLAAHLTERVQILAAVSHDLQTPITRMRLRADLLDDDTAREPFERNLLQMEALVREGIDYARSLHDAEAPRPISVDDLLAALGDEYGDAGKTVQVQATTGTTVQAPPLALRRMLVNLTDNALRYAGSAELRAEVEKGAVLLTVCDRGPGIPEGELDAVFSPFYRVEGSRSRDSGGTGLGLAIARQLAGAMGATLTLHNRAGGGLAARLRLPMR